MTYHELVLNLRQLSLQQLLLLLNLVLVYQCHGRPLLLPLEVTQSLRQRSVHIRPPVQSAELHHIVHQVDDGVDPSQLLLQLPGVLPEVEAGLVSHVPHVVLLRTTGVDGLQEAGGLSAQLDQDQHQLLLALVEEIPCRDVGKIPTKLLKTKL